MLKSVQILVIKTVILSIIGATFTALFFKLKKKDFIFCIVISSLLIIAVLSLVYISYDIKAFDKPEYFGTLKAAPGLSVFGTKAFLK